MTDYLSEESHPINSDEVYPPEEGQAEPKKWYVALKDTLIDFFKPPPCPWGWQTYVKLLVILALIGGLAAGIIFREPIAHFLGKNGALARWVRELGWWGPLIYAAVYAATTVAFIPGTVLTLAAGYVFREYQIWVPFLTISFGSTIGAIIAFILGRSVMRSWVEERVHTYPKFGAVDKAIAKGGWWIVFLLRLSPVIPFNFLNYALSLTAVGVIQYSLSSWIGMMPGTFLYVYIAWTAARAANSGGSHKGTTDLIKKIMLWGVAPLVTIVVVIAVTWLAKREITKAIESSEEQEKQQSAIVSEGEEHHSYHLERHAESEQRPLLN